MKSIVNLFAAPADLFKKQKAKAGWLIALSLVIFNCSSPQGESEEDLKEEAMTFSLKVVEAYIEKDTVAYKTFLTDSLYFLESWEKPWATSDINLTSLFSGFDYTEYSMDDYKETYDPVVMEYELYKNMLDEMVYWQPGEKDYLFIGHRTKEGKTEFMWDDLLGFMVSKRTGKWKIRAVAG